MPRFLKTDTRVIVQHFFRFNWRDAVFRPQFVEDGFQPDELLNPYAVILLMFSNCKRILSRFE